MSVKADQERRGSHPTMSKTVTYVQHRHSGSIYRVLTVLGETLVLANGCVGLTKDYCEIK